VSVGARPATPPHTSWNHRPGGKRTSGGSSGAGSAFSLEVAIPEGQRGWKIGCRLLRVRSGWCCWDEQFGVVDAWCWSKGFVWVSNSTTPVKRSRLGMNFNDHEKKLLLPPPNRGLNRPSSWMNLKSNSNSRSTGNAKSTSSIANTKPTASPTPKAKSTSTSPFEQCTLAPFRLVG